MAGAVHNKGFFFDTGEQNGIKPDPATGAPILVQAGVEHPYALNANKRLSIPALHGKVGATAGWVITAGTNIALATLPASQTGSTLIIPILGLEVGDIIVSLEVHGQVDSGGNAVTVAADLRKAKSDAAAGHTDSSVEASSTMVNAVTADTLIDALITVDPQQVVADDEVYYLLLTGTTLGTTDVEISNIVANILRG